MALCIPKMVILTNNHLTRLFYAMMLVTGLAMAGWFIKSGGYMSAVSLRESVHLNMWVNEPTDEEVSKTLQARMGDVCGNPSDYDYWYDDYWKYNGTDCVNVTSTCNPSDDCLRTRDIYIKENSRQLFFTTFYKDNLQMQTGKTVELKRHYLPQANAFTVNFEYFFTAPRLNMFTTSKPATRGPADEELRLTNKDVMTVFLDAQHDVAWVAAPGESLSASVPTLLELAGYPDHLTTPNSDWGENVLPGAKHPEGPIGLIGGMPVEMFVHCHKHPLPDKDLGEAHKDWTGPTCFVVVSGQKVWSTKYITFPQGRNFYDVDMSGIRITADMDGTWEYFDVNNCILNFTALLVLLSIPKKIIIVLASRTLGHLSTIYRKVIFHKFAIAEQVAGMTARIVAHGASFREMEHSDNLGGLTMSDLHDTIRHLCRYRLDKESPSEQEEEFGRKLSNAKHTFDYNDVGLFTDFAFKAICNPQHGNESPTWRRQWLFHSRFWKAIEAMLESLFGSDFFFFMHHDDKRQHSNYAPRISVDHFLTAAATSEPVELEDLLWLFNDDRHIGYMERFFTPKCLAQHLFNLKAHVPGLEPAEAPPSVEEGEHDMHDHVKRLASDCTLSNRDIIKVLSDNSKGVYSELQQDFTRLSKDMQLVLAAYEAQAGEHPRLSKEMRVVQETLDRLAEQVEQLRAENQELRSQPMPTSENIEQRNPPAPAATMPVGDDAAALHPRTAAADEEASRRKVQVSGGQGQKPSRVRVATPTLPGPTQTSESPRARSSSRGTRRFSRASSRESPDEKHMRNFLQSFSSSLSAYRSPNN